MAAGTDMAPALAGDRQEALRLTATYCATVLGWRLVPMYPGTKKPYRELLPNGRWSPLRGIPTTAADIDGWFAFDPSLNIAVITGPESCVAVVDVDHPSELPKPFQIPPSPQATTRRGFHAYFHADASTIKGTRKLPWGEVIYRGLVLLPPSVHPSGFVYSWGFALAPWEVPLECLPVHLQGLPRIAASATIYATSPRTDGILDGETLRSLYRDETVVSKCCSALGITYTGNGRAFRCVLHKEENPSASIYRDETEDGVFVYRDFHLVGSEGETLTLAEVYASRFAGRVVTFSRLHEGTRTWQTAALCTWSIRLLVDSGVLAGADAPRIVLSGYEPACARRVAEGFNHLLRCKWLYQYGAPSAFTRTFAANWCRMGERQAGEGINYLSEHGYLQTVGSYRWMDLYLPGTVGKI